MSLRRAAAATVLTAVATTGALVAPGTAHAAAPAERAASKGCVTKAEYRKIKKGMTVAKVKKVTGTNGKQVSKSPLGDGRFVVGRAYKACTGKRSGVGIAFVGKDGVFKVESKSAVWK
jgi:hypothetical protein